MRTAIFATLLLAACGTVTSPVLTRQFEQFSTSQLWSRHYASRNPVELAVIEAELGVRGETRTYGDYLGRKTLTLYGQKAYQREDVSTGDYDCSDFSSSAAAQKFFLQSGGPLRDAHDLDRDGDGLACEWGAYLQRTAKQGPKRYKPSYSSRTCYVGPRGGTYTITASGRKNYGVARGKS